MFDCSKLTVLSSRLILKMNHISETRNFRYVETIANMHSLYVEYIPLDIANVLATIQIIKDDL